MRRKIGFLHWRPVISDYLTRNSWKMINARLDASGTTLTEQYVSPEKTQNSILLLHSRPQDTFFSGLHHFYVDEQDSIDFPIQCDLTQETNWRIKNIIEYRSASRWKRHIEVEDFWKSMEGARNSFTTPEVVGYPGALDVEPVAAFLQSTKEGVFFIELSDFEDWEEVDGDIQKGLGSVS